VSETVTVWEAGLYVDGWYGHYSTSRALVRAITELGWEEPEAVDGPGPILTLALFDLATMGPARSRGLSGVAGVAAAGGAEPRSGPV
jgi:hypothetical protein